MFARIFLKYSIESLNADDLVALLDAPIRAAKAKAATSNGTGEQHSMQINGFTCQFKYAMSTRLQTLHLMPFNSACREILGGLFGQCYCGRAHDGQSQVGVLLATLVLSHVINSPQYSSSQLLCQPVMELRCAADSGRIGMPIHSKCPVQCIKLLPKNRKQLAVLIDWRLRHVIMVTTSVSHCYLLTFRDSTYLLHLESMHLLLVLVSTQLYSPIATAEPGAHPFTEVITSRPRCPTFYIL